MEGLSRTDGLRSLAGGKNDSDTKVSPVNRPSYSKEIEDLIGRFNKANDNKLRKEVIINLIIAQA